MRQSLGFSFRALVARRERFRFFGSQKIDALALSSR
jgi:hypothetical protein